MLRLLVLSGFPSVFSPLQVRVVFMSLVGFAVTLREGKEFRQEGGDVYALRSLSDTCFGAYGQGCGRHLWLLTAHKLCKPYEEAWLLLWQLGVTDCIVSSYMGES